MSLWKVPCVWQMMGYMEVKANSAEEAKKQALYEMQSPCSPLPADGEYLEDSFAIDEEGEPLEILEADDCDDVQDNAQPNASGSNISNLHWAGMKQIEKETAYQLFKQGKDVYLLYLDNTKARAGDARVMFRHAKNGGAFGVQITPDEKPKLLSEETITIEINHEEKKVYIGSENSSGCEYAFKDQEDIINHIADYIRDYTKK